MPSSAFFRLFHLQKKFSETSFTKLLSNSYPAKATEDFTNHFSVICPFFHPIAINRAHLFFANHKFEIPFRRFDGSPYPDLF